MIIRLFLFLFLPIFYLYAGPNITELKQALQDNPELLNTPQAKSMMQKKGLSLDDVNKRLNTTTKDSNVSTNTNEIQNSIDFNQDFFNDANITQDNNISDINVTTFKKRVNPFTFKTNSEIEEELYNQQQVLVSKKLSRYSMKFYANNNFIDSASRPTPDNYIVSVGDKIDIHIYGDRDQSYTLDIKNNGNVDLAYIGPVKIGGMKYIDAKKHLKNKLKTHYKMSSFNITMNNYSTIQVTLTGEVKYPGVYNLSSFSTVKDLLIVAQSINDYSSVRNISIKRNSKVIISLDFYDLLFKGKDFTSNMLKHGDIVIIKKAVKLVSIDGYINSSAIFELKRDENLYKLIEYAGGMKPEASKLNIKIDRYSDNLKLETFKLSYKNAKKFKMQNGDKVYIYPLDFTAQNSVDFHGNIIRPGKFKLSGDKTLNTLLKNLVEDDLKKFFLPQTYFNYALIKRYSKDLNYETESFNLSNVLDGSKIIKLNPQDEIFIFAKNDIYSNSFVTTIGDVLTKPGKLQYFSGMTLQDAVHASVVDGVIDDKVRVTTLNTSNNMPKTSFFSLKEEANTKLSAYDEIEVYDYYKTHILEPIRINGEVINPSATFYEEGMTLHDLVEMSGGLTHMAYKNNIEIVRYFIDEYQNRQKEILNYDLNMIDLRDIKLKAYDDITIFKIPKWGERKTIEISGQVKFPGIYTINDGERLVSVLKRAGGFTKEAFVNGTIFARESIRLNQVEQYNRSLVKIKRELAMFNAMPANAKNSNVSSQAADVLNEVILEAKKYQPIGRVSIKIDENLTSLEKSQFNLVLQDKDSITIPTTMDTVTVFGEVFNPTSFIHNSNKDSDFYIELASGFSRTADKDSIYIIHADGTSEPVNEGWFSSNIDIQKGDTIVVPLYIKEFDNLQIWDSVAKIFSSFALTAAAVNSLGVL